MRVMSTGMSMISSGGTVRMSLPRTTKAGNPIGRSQRVSVLEALRLYTVNAAYQQFDEDRLGSIEEGKLADMVVLGRDILTVPLEEIIGIPVEMTLIDGKVVYDSSNP